MKKRKSRLEENIDFSLILFFSLDCCASNMRYKREVKVSTREMWCVGLCDVGVVRGGVWAIER
jgi:hypothetical protein